jgi:hypothetical protein
MVTGPGTKRKGSTGKFAIPSSTEGDGGGEGGGGVAGGGEMGSGAEVMVGAVGDCGRGGGSGALDERGETGEKERAATSLHI